MMNPNGFPGTAHHQALLHQIIAYYQNDPRILAVIIFGSMGRGNWDQYSDLDLDVVIRDNVQIDVLQEVGALCLTFAAMGERAILIVPDKADAADVVLASLLEMSIRYHPLTTTSPNIVESAQLLCGSISLEEVRKAGLANIQVKPMMEIDPVDTFLRYGLAVNRELHRQRFWLALSLLERMRTLVVEMFAQGSGRAYHVFQTHASGTIHEHLARTLPQPTLKGLQSAFLHMLDLVEREYVQLGRTQGLSAAQQLILTELRNRQQHIQFDEIVE